MFYLNEDKRFFLNENQEKALFENNVFEDLIREEAKTISLTVVEEEDMDFFGYLVKKYLSEKSNDEKEEEIFAEEEIIEKTISRSKEDVERKVCMPIDKDSVNLISRINLRKVFLCNKHTGGEVGACDKSCPLFINNGCGAESTAEFIQQAVAKILLLLIEKETSTDNVNAIVAKKLELTEEEKKLL